MGAAPHNSRTQERAEVRPAQVSLTAHKTNSHLARKVGPCSVTSRSQSAACHNVGAMVVVAVLVVVVPLVSAPSKYRRTGVPRGPLVSTAAAKDAVRTPFLHHCPSHTEAGGGGLTAAEAWRWTGG
ncbi:hypothetical protein O3P69_017913 [Scylla paramamosain]|uniref:Uncharacterized protein n=1 Tax=Scylla paramamosain TaxID=85552 RepID=A0AAW0TGY0_SCYPA